jgi:hypothetical protein
MAADIFLAPEGIMVEVVCVGVLVVVLEAGRGQSLPP